jgi:hypothetical protein
MSSSLDIQKFLKGMGEARQRAESAATRAINKAAQHTIGQAQKLAPVDTGALKASGTALPAENQDGRITATIGFNTNYAAAVHERLDVHHDQGQAKYLEVPLRQMDAKLTDFVKEEVRKAL